LTTFHCLESYSKALLGRASSEGIRNGSWLVDDENPREEMRDLTHAILMARDHVMIHACQAKHALFCNV